MIVQMDSVPSQNLNEFVEYEPMARRERVILSFGEKKVNDDDG